MRKTLIICDICEEEGTKDNPVRCYRLSPVAKYDANTVDICDKCKKLFTLEEILKKLKFEVDLEEEEK